MEHSIKKWMFIGKVVFVTFILFSFGPFYHFASANTTTRKQLFNFYEKKIFDLIERGLEPLLNIEMAEGNNKLSIAITSAAKTCGQTSVIFEKLKVPSGFSLETRQSLREINHYFSAGFRALEQGIRAFSEYLKYQSPQTFDIFVLYYEQGILLIEGGLTSLTTIKMELNTKDFSQGKNRWMLRTNFRIQIANL